MASLFRASLRSQAKGTLRLLCSTSSRRCLKTLVVAEHEGGSLSPSSKNLIAAAQLLGKDNSISVLLGGCGPSVHAAADQAAASHSSISQVMVAESKEFHHPLAESWAELIHLIHQKDTFSHIIAASNSFGKDILPRAAALLNVSPVTDIMQILGESLFVRPIYAGNALCTVRYVGSGPCMMSIRPTSFRTSVSPTNTNTKVAEILTVDVSSLDREIIGKSTWLNQSSQKAERPDLGAAQIVVSGGRGLKNAENFKFLEKLADKLNAAVGATRAAVDAEFVPNELQIGQTGKIVAPELYFAFGISGAIQHIAGMKDSKVIVAVNKDADAPIFQVADYGLVADIFQVIPELVEKLPQRK